MSAGGRRCRAGGRAAASTSAVSELVRDLAGFAGVAAGSAEGYQGRAAETYQARVGPKRWMEKDVTRTCWIFEMKIGRLRGEVC